jgi:putative addiction module component (TIGR02574 family)
MGDPREIESEALQLQPNERARLAQRLLASLDTESDRVWLQEAERRLDELESGKVTGIAAEQVFKRARSTLR